MVTSAVMLPLLIVIVLGIWWVSIYMYFRWTFRQSVNDAAQYISENARYWNINPDDADSPYELLPADWYDYQAKRIIWSRLRDVLPYDAQVITDSLTVTVTEPAIATGGVEDDPPICSPTQDQPGDYRKFEDVGFMVYADFKIPSDPPGIYGGFSVRIPWSEENWGLQPRYFDRAIGHIQCPRWQGKASEDVSRELGAEGPPLPFRRPITAVPTPPSVTPAPSPTPQPTATPTETPMP